jgi:hypothetical protein
MKSVTTPSTQTELLGMDIGIGSITLTNTAIAARYPISYGYSLNDPVAGTFSSTILSGSSSGSMITTADGLGTLKLPVGITLNNVLRYKSYLTASLKAGVLSVGSVKQITYAYYHSSQKFPVLTIMYTTLTTINSSTPTVLASVRGNANVVISVPTIKPGSADARIFPNPASSTLELKLQPGLTPTSIDICDNTGALVYSDVFSDHLDVSRFKNGLYFINIRTDKGVIRKKLIKE